MRWAVSSPRPASTSTTTTLAPCAPKRSAVAWPIPEAPPVTSATFPSYTRLISGSLLDLRLPCLGLLTVCYRHRGTAQAFRLRLHTPLPPLALCARLPHSRRRRPLR